MTNAIKHFDDIFPTWTNWDRYDNYLFKTNDQSEALKKEFLLLNVKNKYLKKSRIFWVSGLSNLSEIFQRELTQNV